MRLRIKYLLSQSYKKRKKLNNGYNFDYNNINIKFAF